MRAFYNALVMAAGISILAACTGGQSGIQPPSTGANVQSNSSLQFRVGTARFADGTLGLNTVVTFRQPSGLSATLYNEPTITGPAGFMVPDNAITDPGPTTKQADVGTNTIQSTPPTQPGTTAVITTFNQSGGAYAYGFANANSSTSGAANYAQYVAAGTNTALYRDQDSAIIVGPGKGNSQNVIEPNIFGQGRIGAIASAYMTQFYVSSSRRIPTLIGPPAVPDFHDGTFPAGFLGYDSGTNSFGTAPVAGTYSLTVVVPGPNLGVNTATFTQAATLGSAAGLPPYAATPITTEIPGGGASFAVPPGPAGVTNQLLYVVDVRASDNHPTFYSFAVPAAGGTFVLSPTSGPKNAAGTPTAPFAAGDSVYAYVIGSDYDMLAAAVPLNMAQSPTLPAQADIVLSLVYEIAY